MRALVKAIGRGVALALVSPFLLSYVVRSRVLSRDRALEGSTQALAGLPGLIGQYMRRAFLSKTLAHCSPTVTIEYGTIFSQTGARLDDDVYIGPGCHIGLAHLERGVLVAGGVHIPSGRMTHSIDDPDLPIIEQEHRREAVRVGAGTWIGSNAVIMADVGANTVIGAGAVVTHTVPSGVMAAGVPARTIRVRRTA